MHCCKRKSSVDAAVAGKRRRHRKCTLMFGMLVGIGLGLLFAPAPGSETFGRLRENLIRRLPV